MFMSLSKLIWMCVSFEFKTFVVTVVTPTFHFQDTMSMCRVLNHRLVILVLCSFGPDGMQRRQKDYTGLSGMSYVQFVAAHVSCTGL